MYEYLPIDLSWGKDEMRVFLPISAALVFFVVYWFTAQSEKIKSHFYNKYDHDDASVKHIFSQNISVLFQWESPQQFFV